MMTRRTRLLVLSVATMLHMASPTAGPALAEEKKEPSSAVDAYNCVVGTQTFAASYQFTKETKLVETARAILDMGSNTLKFGMAPDTYANSPSRPPDIHSLKDLAVLDPSTRRVLDMPFANYVIWVSPLSVDGDRRRCSRRAAPRRIHGNLRPLAASTGDVRGHGQSILSRSLGRRLVVDQYQPGVRPDSGRGSKDDRLDQYPSESGGRCETRHASCRT